MNLRRLSCLVLVAACICCHRDPPEPFWDPGMPRVFMAKAEDVTSVKKRVAQGDPALAPAVAKLLEEADLAMAAGPFSVTQSGGLPPSGNNHDYASLSSYFWPDPEKPDGLPYIYRDGETNPESVEGDFVALISMSDAVQTLGIAYYLTDEERYAQKAAELLRVWFLNEETRMRPNLNHSQAVPGKRDGSRVGIIDAHYFCYMIDAIGLLEESRAWTAKDDEGLKGWMNEYLEWLRHSEFGRRESAAANNHGTAYALQAVSVALYLRKRNLARQMLFEVQEDRIAGKIRPDGSQPEELRRTRPLFYSIFNLKLLCLLARLGEKVDVDLWGYKGPEGQSIRTAVDYLLPYADGAKLMKPSPPEAIRYDRLAQILRMAAVAYGHPEYERIRWTVPDPYTTSRRYLLLHPLPANGSLPERPPATEPDGRQAPPITSAAIRN